ncbi:ATPase, partial [Enterococcus faecium]
QDIRERFPREAEIPFDSDRKLMTTIHTFNHQKAMLVKGGPDVMFERCSFVLIDGKKQPLTDELLGRFQNANEEFSKNALRVLAYGYKEI